MAEATARVRVYAQGIGDCILVDLPKDNGGRFHLLIDCGVHQMTPGGNDRMEEVVADIAARTGGRLDAIAGTHEHWDHLSAYLTAREAFTKLEIGAVWLSWAEDPADALAMRLDRFKGDMTALVAGLRSRIAFGFGADAPAVQQVDSLTSFLFGAAGEKVRSAREALRLLAPAGNPPPLKPGSRADAGNLPGVRIWVLGPPRDESLLMLHDNPGNEYRLGAGPSMDRPFAAVASALDVADGRATLEEDPFSPFDGDEGVPLSALAAGRWDVLAEPADRQFLWRTYFEGSDPSAPDHDPVAARRRIDGTWMTDALDFALRLDNNTNNTSLVLAIELTETGHVLLFAADAQAGAWKSFQTLTLKDQADEIAAPALLARTVFYKAGHHGSVNATARDMLEAMDPSRLVAFVPVDAKVAKEKCRWNDFPARKVMAALDRMTQGRLVASDSPWLRDGTAPTPPLADWTKADGPLVEATSGMAGQVPWVEFGFR